MEKNFKQVGSKVALIAMAISLTLPGTANASQRVNHDVVVQMEAPNKLVPLREIMNHIGGEITWDGATKTITVSRGATTFSFKLGDSSVTVNGFVKSFDANINAVNGVTMFPLEFIQETFGAKVDWNPETQKVQVSQDDLITQATKMVYDFNMGNYGEASRMFSQDLKEAFPEQVFANYWMGNMMFYGETKQLLQASLSENGVHSSVNLLYKAENMPLNLEIRFDKQGMVDDLFINFLYAGPSAYQPPAYDDPSKYIEKEIVLGEGKFALPGTLTMPAGAGPFPVVVLVHGSGPNDRDESMGSMKTFRDLAVGLASKGVATLRYEKISRQHPVKSYPLLDSVKRETVDDAITAVQFLKQQEGIDADKIFVIGHSQGGMLIPRIIEADINKGIAGTIVLAGPSRPLEDLMIEQVKFQVQMLKDSGQPQEMIAMGEQQLAFLEKAVSILKDPQYSVDNLPENFGLQGSPKWWFDFRNYYAGEIAKHQEGPLLIIQGEKDIQVFVQDFEGWKEALKDRTDVTYKLYSNLNHFMVEVEGPATGAEYMLPANVPYYLIEDISNWIFSIGSKE